MRPKEKTPPPALTRAPTLRLCVVYSRLGHWASFEETTVLLKITSKTNNLVILQMGKLRPREKTCPGSWESAKPRPRTPTMEVFFLHPHSPKNRKGHGEAKAKVAGGCGGGRCCGQRQSPAAHREKDRQESKHAACRMQHMSTRGSGRVDCLQCKSRAPFPPASSLPLLSPHHWPPPPSDLPKPCLP
jgi:hypothetical protein